MSQERSRRPVTRLRPRGGNFRACASDAAKKVSTSRKRRRVRQLRGNGHGRFRTDGRYSATTVRGTAWRVEDRCDGIYTLIRRGRAVVFDFVRKRKSPLEREMTTWPVRPQLPADVSVVS